MSKKKVVSLNQTTILRLLLLLVTHKKTLVIVNVNYIQGGGEVCDSWFGGLLHLTYPFFELFLHLVDHGCVGVQWFGDLLWHEDPGLVVNETVSVAGPLEHSYIQV